jgi:prepilin-type N-terminal cleavage/methylation domain-containing protein
VILSQKRGRFPLPRSAKRHAGFSLTELVVTIAVALVLMAIGLPAFLRAYHAYELSNATREVADILRLARYEAIRLNTPVQCVIQASGTSPGYTNVWVDSNPNLTLDPTEKMVLLDPSGNLVDGGSVPGTSSLISAAVGSSAVTSPSPTSSGVWFDARGAVKPPSGMNVSSTVTVYYVTSAVAPDAGYRAVLLMPAGSIEIWAADSSGSWQQQR